MADLLTTALLDLIEHLRFHGFEIDFWALSSEDVMFLVRYLASEMFPVEAMLMDCDCHASGSCLLCRDE